MLELLLICVLYGVNGGLVGPVTIKENGKDVTRYVVSTYPPLASVSGSTIKLQHDSQVQISMNSSNTYTPYMFMEYKLQDKTLSYTVDLSSISCSCNTGIYFASMPAIGSNGQPVGGQYGDYYCDANDVNKEWCWELDTMEANKYTMAVTPHSCSQPPGTYITNCDRGGCGTNAYNVNNKGMCPDSSCKINTQQPFRYSIHFGETYQVTLTQNNQTYQFISCPNNNQYIQNMQKALNYGMTMIITHWGSTYSTMKWLDGMTGCTGDCDGKGIAVFSDIEIS